MKLCFVDLETTGTDYQKHAIIQIAGSIAELSKDNILTIKENFNYQTKPNRGEMVTMEALRITNTNIQELNARPEPVLIYREFVALLGKYVDKYEKKDKFFFVGYNSRFDDDFMREFFRKNGDEYYGSYFFFPPIDVMNMAIVVLMKERASLPNFKLGTLIDHFKIQKGNLHDANEDIRLTIELFLYFYKRMQ